MNFPLEITYRKLEKRENIDALIREKVTKLEDVCDRIIGCHVVVERTHSHPSQGSPYRVRIDLTLPPNQSVVVTKNPNEGIQYSSLQSIIRDAFEAAHRQVKEVVEQQQGRVKHHSDTDLAYQEEIEQQDLLRRKDNNLAGAVPADAIAPS